MTASFRPRRLLGITSFAVLMLVSPATAQTAEDILEEHAKKTGQQFGQSLGSYIGIRLKLKMDIEQLATAVARCGSCPDLSRLQAQLAKLRAKNAMIDEMEGALLQSMDLRFNNFSEFMSALVADFTSNRLNEFEQRAQDMRFRSFAQDPVNRWCRLFEPAEAGRVAGSKSPCASRWNEKWAKELGVQPWSDDLAYAVHRRNIQTAAMCTTSLQKLRGVFDPPRSEIEECQASMFEWAKLRNEGAAWCIQQGALVKLTGDGSIHPAYRMCDDLIAKRGQRR